MKMHWSDRYPHDLHASVILKHSKIKLWKVGSGKLCERYNVADLQKERPEYSYYEKTWEVNNHAEHEGVFDIHAPEWFRQWPHADDYVGFPAYSNPMKTITLWQPWATLVMLRLKGFETRSWPTKYRGPLAIHAGKRVDQEACEREPIRSELAKYGFTADNLPTGAVLGAVVLTDCLRSMDTWTDGYILENGVYVYSPEYEYGDFTPGRYAWELREAREFPRPIPAKGKQGLWNWEDIHGLVSQV